MQGADILILLSDSHLLQGPIAAALSERQIPFESRDVPPHLAEDWGRALFAMTRIVINADDYLAHRSLFGLLPRVGVGTCLSVGQKVVENGLNYRNIFYAPAPAGVFSAREATFISLISVICSELATWSSDDLLQERRVRLIELHAPFGDGVQVAINEFLTGLPQNLTLRELREFMGTMSAEKRARILADAYQRSGAAPPAPPESKVRIMTMHGAKGLSARVVFVPGLEEQVFPGPRRRPFPGLIEEAARLLYVSITRARVACVLSFARRRIVHGHSLQHAPSQFNQFTGGAFQNQNGGAGVAFIQKVMNDCAGL